MAGSTGEGTVAGCSGSAGVPGSGTAGEIGASGTAGVAGSVGCGTSAAVDADAVVKDGVVIPGRYPRDNLPISDASHTPGKPREYRFPVGSVFRAALDARGRGLDGPRLAEFLEHSVTGGEDPRDDIAIVVVEVAPGG